MINPEQLRLLVYDAQEQRKRNFYQGSYRPLVVEYPRFFGALDLDDKVRLSPSSFSITLGQSAVEVEPTVLLTRHRHRGSKA